MEEWKEYKLGEVCDTISETYKRGAQDVVLINTSDVLEGKCLNHTKVTNENLKGQFKKTFQLNDILYSEIRPANKRFAYIDFDATDYIASTKLMVLRHNDKILPQYLFYILKSQNIIDILQMLAESRSGTFPQITFSELANLDILLPNKELQNKIVSILSSLDDKIEVNRRINEQLEEMAQALFKSWFVDFEPFKEQPFVETELGMIPEGWKVYKLSDFLPIITGKKDANVAQGGDYPFFSCSQECSWINSYSFDGSAILVAGNGDFNVKMYVGKFEAYQRTYVLIPHNPQYTAWLYYAIKYSLKEITSAARGSVIKFITKSNLADFKFTAPMELKDSEIIKKFDSIKKTIAHNQQEILHLITLRDTLLPKLMSGEIDVNE